MVEVRAQGIHDKVLLPRFVYAANAKFVAFYHKPKPKRVWLLGLGFGFGFWLLGLAFGFWGWEPFSHVIPGFPEFCQIVNPRPSLGLAFRFWVWLLSLAFGSRQHV